MDNQPVDVTTLSIETIESNLWRHSEIIQRSEESMRILKAELDRRRADDPSNNKVRVETEEVSTDEVINTEDQPHEENIQ